MWHKFCLAWQICFDHHAKRIMQDRLSRHVMEVTVRMHHAKAE